MKIGIVTQYYPPNILGGSHLSIFYLAKGLSMKGHDITIFTSKILKNNKDVGKYALKKVTIKRIFNKSYSHGAFTTLKKEVHMTRKLKNYLNIKKTYFDVLFSYGMDTIPAVFSSRQFAKKIAASVNGSWATSPYYHINYKGEENLQPINWYFWLDTFMRIFYKKIEGSGSAKWQKIFFSPAIYIIFKRRFSLLKKMDMILPLSYKLKKILINGHISSKKIYVTPNLFEKDIVRKKEFLHKKYNIQKNKRIILYAGRLLKIKGCKTFIDAIAIIIKKKKKIHFLLLGSGSEKKELKKQVQKLHITSYVTFGGFINNKKLAKAYKDSFLTVYPVHCFDALPRTPTESFFQGTPVIGTNMGGIPELVIHGKTGLVVKPNNDKQLAKAILKLLKDDKLYKKLCEGAKKHSKHFLISRGINKYISAFKCINEQTYK